LALIARRHSRGSILTDATRCCEPRPVGRVMADIPTEARAVPLNCILRVVACAVGGPPTIWFACCNRWGEIWYDTNSSLIDTGDSGTSDWLDVPWALGGRRAEFEPADYGLPLRKSRRTVLSSSGTTNTTPYSRVHPSDTRKYLPLAYSRRRNPVYR